mgnify:CR=1 FL=1
MEIHEECFAAKKGSRRKTAVPAYRIKSRISRSLKLLSRELNRLYNEGKVPMEDYNILRTCLSHYTEYVPVDKRYKLAQEE